MDFSTLPATQVNWAECFTHYCGGMPLEDVATMMGCPLHKLELRCRNERWASMKARVEAQMHSLVPVHPDEIARRANLIQANREANHRAWCKLRDHANEVIDQLRETKGKEMMKRYWHNKGTIIARDCDISLSDLNALANYFQVICQGTYAALGDRVSQAGAKDDGGQSPTNSGVPTIQIILPGVISKPRAERGVDDAKPVKGDVIEA